MQGNIVNLAANPFGVQQWINGPFALRAIASDCNNNGVFDACDIASGVSLDLNNNGIPDECEVPACVLADIFPAPHGDGVVNVNDLLHVINNWGGCDPCYAICPGDVDDDCLVNVNDLLAVINGWGPCGAEVVKKR